MNKKNILFIETFYGGAHKLFADTIIEYSSHTFSLVTLLDEIWRWRQKVSSFLIANKIRDIVLNFDVVFISDLVNLSELKALVPNLPPVVLYMHENQMTYPANDSRNDFHSKWIDFTNVNIADRVIFNSFFHKSAFEEAVKKFLKQIPQFKNIAQQSVMDFKDKTTVLYPPIRELPLYSKKEPNGVKRIVWNHRWEFDKAPKRFLKVMIELQKEGIPFELILLGESEKYPSNRYGEYLEILEPNIRHSGFVESYNEYLSLLQSGDIIVSVSDQENFGISVSEAVSLGLIPLLPNRLSYPEIIPSKFHSTSLYNSLSEFKHKLTMILLDNDLSYKEELQNYFIKNYSVKNTIDKYDTLFDTM